MEYANLKISDLKSFPIRSIRQNVIKKLKGRISQGYNPARPLSVIRENGHYLTADGNHRLQVLVDLGVEYVPCVIYDDVDPYPLAVKCNQDEETYAPMDLFDWLDIIGRLRDEGLTQAKIGERIGWSREAVKNYVTVLDNIGANILNSAKEYQTGRVPENGTNVPAFNFTEGLFRNILPLTGDQQLNLIKKLVKGKDQKGRKYVKADFKAEAATLKKYNILVENGFAEIKNKVFGEVAEKAKNTIISEFAKNTYLNESEDGTLGRKASQLIQAFIDEYEKDQNIKVFTKAIEDITSEDISDESVDVIITDPPYPKEYVDLFDELGKLAERVLRPGGSLVCLVGQSHIPQYIEYLSRHLDYYWVIGVHMPGGQAVQVWNRNINAFWKPALWFTKGERSKDAAWVSDFIQTNTNNNDKNHHHWGQSEQLMKSLIERAAMVGDTVVDPFLGGGTVGVVCKEMNIKFIGSDKSENAVLSATKRINGAD